MQTIGYHRFKQVGLLQTSACSSRTLTSDTTLLKLIWTNLGIKSLIPVLVQIFQKEKTMKTVIESRIAKAFALAITLTILVNGYFFATLTHEVKEGDQITLLAWLEGDDQIAVLAWQQWHPVIFETNQWNLYGNIVSGKLHMVHSPAREMPYDYFYPGSQFANTNFSPRSMGTFFFTDEGYFQDALKTAKIALYKEVDGSFSIYAYTTWQSSDEELLINNYATRYTDSFPYTNPRWDPRMDCLKLWYFHEDVGLSTMEYDEVNHYCSGNWGWPQGHSE